MSDHLTPEDVTVYTMPACPRCEATKRALTRAGVPFETVDLASRPDLAEELKAKGFREAPVVVAGELAWCGFRPDRIRALTRACATGTTGNASNAGNASHTGNAGNAGNASNVINTGKGGSASNGGHTSTTRTTGNASSTGNTSNAGNTGNTSNTSKTSKE